MKRASRAFTLIEIMTVIVIIGILSSILFPVLGTVREKGKVSETQTIVTGVKTAIMAYYSDNGFLPSTSARVGSWSGNINKISVDSEYYKFFDILTYSNHSSATSSVSSDVKENNPKAQRYLDTPKKYFSSDKHLNSIRDSWNRPLVIYLDSDLDGSIDVDDDYGGGTYVTNCVVLSLGSQTETEFNKVKSSGTSNYISSSK